MADLPIQSKCYKRRLRRKVEKERQKKIRRSEVKRIISSQDQKFGEESNKLDKNLNENSDELLEPEMFCGQNQESEIASNIFLYDRIKHARESEDFEMNNNSFVVDSEEELRESSSDNNTTDYNENEQSTGSANDNDDGVFQFPYNEAKEMYVTETIREWALEGGVLSMEKLNNLLLRLHVVHPTLPKNYKSLLKTPRHLNIIQMEQAEIWYKSIRFNLDAMLLEEYLKTYRQICIDVNMDGLPISKSSPLKFWPILGRLIGSKNEPFVISIYFGKTDPTDVRNFLNDFVNEVEDLFQNGYTFNGITYPFLIRNFILDAPARSLVKCCIGHGGYGACEKCIVIGETVHSRRVYIELNEPLRTDESFKNKEQPLHHCGQSPLEQINIGMVSQFRLDPFHLAWHGVFRRLLDVWLTWNGPWKLHREIRWNISFLLLSIADTCPSDFVRKPRSLKEWTMYKATEERRLCLYDGIVVFKDNLHKNVYRHFLMLHGALTILSSPMLVQSEIMCYYADDLLKAFINHSIVIYGKIFVVYNVHALAHLAQECLSHGSLDEFSAFPFENFLKSLKSLLKSGYKPLQQVARRDIEKTVSVSVHLSTNDKEVTLSHRHYYCGEVIEGSYFKKISIGDVVLKIGRRDSCFMTIDGNVFLLQNVVKRRKDIYLITNKFNKKEDFYVYPFPSSHLRIFKVSNLSDERIVVALADIQSKCWLIPYKEFFVSVPLLHTIPTF